MSLAFSGARSGAEWLHKSSVLGGPNNGDKIRSGYIPRAFSGTPNWVECLHNECGLGGPPTRQRKPEMTISPAVSGARKGAEWLNEGAFLGDQTMGTKLEVAISPMPSLGPRIG